MTSHLFLVLTTTLLITLPPRHVASRLPAPSPSRSPAPAPEVGIAVDTVARDMGLTPEQRRQVAGAAARLGSRSPLLSPGEEGLALTPEQRRQVAGAAARLGSRSPGGEGLALTPEQQHLVAGMGPAGSPLLPAVVEAARSELSPERAERIKRALSPESTRKGKDMARDMINRIGMSPEQRQKATGDAEGALSWGNSQLKNILGADSKETAAPKSGNR